MEEMGMVELTAVMERLSVLESAMEKMAARQEVFAAEAEETVGRIVATVETAREAELERKLAEAEAKVAELSAAAVVGGGRKTVAAGVGRMFSGEGFEAGVVDAALASLSVEQRIAVKAGLLRGGLVG